MANSEWLDIFAENFGKGLYKESEAEIVETNDVIEANVNVVDLPVISWKDETFYVKFIQANGIDKAQIYNKFGNIVKTLDNVSDIETVNQQLNNDVIPKNDMDKSASLNSTMEAKVLELEQKILELTKKIESMGIQNGQEYARNEEIEDLDIRAAASEEEKFVNEEVNTSLDITLEHLMDMTSPEDRITVTELQNIEEELEDIDMEITEIALIDGFHNCICPLCTTDGLCIINEDDIGNVFIECPECKAKFKVDVENDKIYVEE